MKVMRGADFKGSPREPDDLGMMQCFQKNIGTTVFFFQNLLWKIGVEVYLLLKQTDGLTRFNHSGVHPKK